MKMHFFESVSHFSKIPQITKHIFLLRSTFFIEDFVKNCMLVLTFCFLTIFQAEGPRLRLHFLSKHPLQKCA